MASLSRRDFVSSSCAALLEAIQHDIITGAPEGKRNRPADAAGGACLP